MKRKGLLVGVAVLAVVLIAFLAGCGGGTSSGSLDEYKEAMQGWVDEYDSKLTESVAVLETITDPLSATAEQVEGAKAFADLMGEAASRLNDIEAPADLAASHKAYADGLTTLAGGIQQYAKAMENGSAEELAAAMGPMAASDQIEQAETALEAALGFKLTSD